MIRSEPVPVSVVIPCFRCASTIGRAIESVLTQTRPPRQIVLVDDASDDQTLDVLNHYARSSDGIQFEIESLRSNVGPGGARNAGWKLATQPLVAFLDSDDTWHASKLEFQSEWMHANPHVILTGHPVARAPAREVSRNAERLSATPVSVCALLRSNRFQTSSVMVRGELLLRFRDGMRYCEDFDLWLRVVLSGLPTYQLGRPLAHTFKDLYGHSGLSAQLWNMEQGELRALAYARDARLLGVCRWMGATAWSLCKFVVRGVRTMLRRAVRHESDAVALRQ